MLTEREYEALRRDLFASLHCALPGTVERYDAETGLAAVRPALRSLWAPGDVRPWPLLEGVPVFLPVFSDPDLSLSVSPGDACLLIFADRSIDGWLASGQATLPVSDRMHDLSDAFAIVGRWGGAGVRKGG